MYFIDSAHIYNSRCGTTTSGIFQLSFSYSIVCISLALAPHNITIEENVYKFLVPIIFALSDSRHRFDLVKVGIFNGLIPFERCSIGEPVKKRKKA